MIRTRLNTLLPTALLIATCIAGGAHAASAERLTRAASADLSGLDLATANGQEAARERIDAAARKACSEPGLYAPAPDDAGVACEQDAARGAEPALQERIASASRPSSGMQVSAR